MAERRRRSAARAALLNAALLGATLALCAGALEIGVRLFGPGRGDWYAAGPGRAQFLREHVSRNADGFRDRPFPREKASDGIRILAVGDSFTFGDGIPDVDDTWPRQLEARLRETQRRVEVFNFGVPGTNTAFQRRLLRDKGWALAPDRIVLGFVPNDPEPPGANRDAVPRRLNPPLIPIPALDARLSRASYAWAWLRGKRNALAERLGWKETYGDYVRSLYRPGPNWDAFVEEASGLVGDARARGVGVTVVLFPLFFDLEHDPFARETETAAEVFREAGADVLDLREAFAGRPTASLAISASDAHPNETAHRIAAEAIAAHLARALRGTRPGTGELQL